MTASSPLPLRLAETGYAALARPLLFRLDAERVHHATLTLAHGLGASAVGRRALRTAAGGSAAGEVPEVRLWGLRFAHPVGLGAGMDKDARAVPAWSALGFSHVEVGTVTARPQPGNPRPRLVRLPRSRAIVNRMGFNNRGAKALAETLRTAREAGLVDIPVGASIGKTKTTPVHDAVDDYLTSVAALTGLADYFAVNVSSPNTPGLRGLQDREPLEQLLRAVVRAAGGTPVLVKLAPDLDDAALEDAIEVARGSGVAGLVATNTTTSRPVELLHPSERHTAGQEAGGLSGAPLTARARQVVARVTERTDLPVIGVGGIMTGADARAMLEAGASLVQLYSGLVYRGPALVGEAVRA